ncbi:MAG: DUF2231 domain-containing protein [Vicinamibacterales bacterium]
MPSLAEFHPEVVHFVVALVFVGVGLRLISLTGRLRFSGPAATTLIVISALASVVAVKSGADAHGPVERIPGVRPAVVEHEEWGERARNGLLLLALVEITALALAAREHPRARTAAMVAAVVGLAGTFMVYEAAEHGGALVYEYAGGIGTRSGDPEDIANLLVAGVYQQAQQDRAAGHPEQSTPLVHWVANRYRDRIDLQLMAAEWQTEVEHEPEQALARLDALDLPVEDARLRVRAGILRANALLAQGNRAGALGVLQTLKAEYPTNPQIQRRIDAIEGR